MITWTIDYTNDGLVLSSTELSSWIATLPSPTYTLTLTYTKKSSGTETTTSKTIASTDSELSTSNETYTLTGLADGVYSVTITNSSTSNVETACIFYDADTKCCMIDHIAAKPDSPLLKIYFLLKEVNDCADCYCEDGGLVFEYLDQELDIVNNVKKSNCSDCN